jgi:hypothetical protein
LRIQIRETVDVDPDIKKRKSPSLNQVGHPLGMDHQHVQRSLIAAAPSPQQTRDLRGSARRHSRFLKKEYHALAGFSFRFRLHRRRQEDNDDHGDDDDGAAGGCEWLGRRKPDDGGTKGDSLHDI